MATPVKMIQNKAVFCIYFLLFFSAIESTLTAHEDNRRLFQLHQLQIKYNFHSKFFLNQFVGFA